MLVESSSCRVLEADDVENFLINTKCGDVNISEIC